MKTGYCLNKKLPLKFAGMAKFLRVISDDNRLKILCLLKGGEHCVCEIWQNLDLAQNLISSHLKILRDFGLIVGRQEGKRTYYSIDPVTFKKYNSILTNFLKEYEYQN